ncbi:MAG: protein kinase [Myxococcota bacterium]
MNCPSCDHDNRRGARFCEECGARFAQSCSACGVELRAGAGFCDACGQSQQAAELPPARPEAPPSHPESFAAGRYQVRGFIGEGAKKRVYHARDTRLDRDVALGVIKTEGLDANGRLRVEREARAMGRLGEHPHIVNIYDVVDEDGALYVVSQYVAGGDLAHKLAGAPDHRLPVEEALRIADEMAQALEHAHGAEVVHRDIKPGNIYLGADGSAKLGDFGLAVSLDRTRLTQEGMMVGTVAYMPPEQALGSTPDARSDLYALGALLYELVTGRPPFVGDDAVAIISQHINTQPVAPSWHNSEVSRPLEELILALLEKDPERRPESAARLREALGRISSLSEEGAALARQDANPLDRLASGVFVGRDRELEQLRSGLDEALSGRGRILLLVGEPGIGKTRTCEELATYARMRGAQVLWGRCYEGEGAPAYWPWMQIIRSYVHEREPQRLMSEMGPGAAQIADVVSEVRERLPGLPVAPKLDPEEARFLLFDAITTFLKNASGNEPLVLLLDDLHWADKPSLLLFQFLAAELAQSRLLLVGTYRDVELGRHHPLEETLAELARTQTSERVLLRGLTEADVARFIELSSGRAPPPALVEAVYRETEGNPFFVHEVVHLLQGDGRLDRAEDVESWSVEIPQGVRQVIGRRLNGLSEECNRVLAIASVIGREFELSLLAEVSEFSEDALLDVLELAEDARVISEQDDRPGTYRFAHALIRETLYDELRTIRRIRLHGRIALAIELRDVGRLAELAYHFGEAASGGDVGKAVDYAVRAAEREKELAAWEQAARQYERAVQALEAAQPVDETRRCQLLSSLADAHFMSGANELGWDTARAALARRLEPPGLFARAAIMLCRGQSPHWPLPDQQRIEVVEEALERLGGAEAALGARLTANLAIEVGLAGERERQDALFADAVEMARRSGVPGGLAMILWLRLRDSSDEDPHATLEAADETVALAREAGARQVEFNCRLSRMGALVGLADPDAFAAELALQREVAEELRLPHALMNIASWEAGRALWQGDLASARRLSWESWTIGRRVNEPVWVQTYGTHLYGLRQMQGRVAEQLPGLLAGIERFARAIAWPCLLACAYTGTGQEANARRVFEELAAEDFSGVFASNTPNLVLAADVCASLRDEERAVTLYERLSRYKGLYVPSALWAGVCGSVPRALARLAAVMGRLEDAENHFERALEVDRKMGARGWLPRTQCDYARMLLDRDAPGDRDRALALLAQALETCQELGLKGWLDMCLEQKLRAQGLHSGTLTTTIHAIADSIEERRPDLTSHASPDGTVTLMFSDMENYSGMLEGLGDIAAHELMQEHNAIVREQTRLHGGHEVELRGDGFLLAFASARQAVLCAIALQRAFHARSSANLDQAIRIRIGLHTGETIKDADKFFGKSVVQAFRVADLAGGGEILVSSLTRDLVANAGDLALDEGREVELKGLAGAHRVFAVSWQ